LIYKKIKSNDKQDVVFRNGFIDEKDGLFYAGMELTLKVV